MKIRSILCPTDFSDFSDRALEHATGIARWYGAELTIAHSYPYVVVGRGAPYFPSGLALDASTRAKLLDELEAAAKPARAAGLKPSLVLLEGDPSDEILKRSRAVPTDLIVMGTHGLRGFDRWLLGSVAARIVEKASCAVLTVPQAPEGTRPSPSLYGKVLCPVDLVDSEATLDAAASIARAAKARLSALHVLEDLPQYEAAAGMAHIDWAEFREGLEREALERLRRAAGRAGDGDAPECLVRSGKPYREILKLAHSNAASLIVMGIHGRKPLERFFFGSTTLHVVRQARCPVWTARASAERVE
jgi:nucleotide-binding universal stress UspA family protein